MPGAAINLSAGLSLFSEHLPDIRKACVENIRELELTPGVALGDDDAYTKEAVLQHIQYLKVEALKKPMLQIIRRIDARRAPRTGATITDTDIARAKEVPIEELYEGQLFGRKRKMGLCPFHNEVTPSFYIYTTENRFKCYGCQAYGTTVDFIMLRDGVSFIAAVKTLLKR